MDRLRGLHLEGTILGGKYHFVRRIGGGGYGDVWLVEVIDLRRTRLKDVAVKIFPAHSTDREEMRVRVDQFSRESERTAKARRGQLFVEYFTYEMFDLWVAEDGTVRSRTTDSETSPRDEELVTLFMLVMEYADGGSLGPEYRTQYILKAQDPSYLNHFIDVTTAIASMHSEGVIHCDIKESNLMLFRKENLVKVGDLGIARVLDGPTGRGIVGTPEYMSPEALSGIDGPDRDRYALACTLYSLLTGTLPFSVDPTALATGIGPYIDAWKEVHRTAERPDAVRQAPSTVSVHLSGLLKQMMAPDQANRPDDLRPLLEALQKEKQFRFPTVSVHANGVRAREIPSGPVQRSRYTIDPEFRMTRLEEVPFLIFIDMDHATPERRGLLLAFAEEYFGDTFSLCEVYGRHDFVLRVWATPSRKQVERFCEDVIRQVLYGTRNAISIMPIEEVVYPGTERKWKDSIDVAEAKICLNDAQLARRPINNARIEAAEDWLKRHGVFARPRSDSYSSSRIKAFTLVFPRIPLSQYEEEAMFAKVVRRLEILRSGKAISAISAMRRQFAPLSGLDPKRHITHVQAPVVVKFVASKYEHIIDVPQSLMGEFDGQGVRTTTLLSTKRLLIESDQIAPQ